MLSTFGAGTTWLKFQEKKLYLSIIFLIAPQPSFSSAMKKRPKGRFLFFRH
jgi:hypothetical protein